MMSHIEQVMFAVFYDVKAFGTNQFSGLKQSTVHINTAQVSLSVLGCDMASLHISSVAAFLSVLPRDYNWVWTPT